MQHKWFVIHKIMLIKLVFKSPICFVALVVKIVKQASVTVKAADPVSKVEKKTLKV